MKRLLVFLVCSALGGGGPSLVLASSPGNPLFALGKGRLAVSAEWEQGNRTLDLETESGVTSNRYWLKGTYGLLDWLDLSAAGGAVDFDVSTSHGTQSLSFESDHLTFGFCGAAKVRVLHSEEQNVGVFAAINGAHLYTEEFVGSLPPEKFSWNEFQLAVGATRRYGFASPYFGVSYSLVDGELTWDGGNGEDFRDPGGLAFGGIEISLPGRYAVTFEVNGRIGGNSDEISFSVGVSQTTE